MKHKVSSRPLIGPRSSRDRRFDVISAHFDLKLLKLVYNLKKLLLTILVLIFRPYILLISNFLKNETQSKSHLFGFLSPSEAERPFSFGSYWIKHIQAVSDEVQCMANFSWALYHEKHL